MCGQLSVSPWGGGESLVIKVMFGILHVKHLGSEIFILKFLPSLPSPPLCHSVVVTSAEATDDVNCNITATRFMVHNNSILPPYFMMMHCLIDVKFIYCTTVWSVKTHFSN